MRQLLAYLFSVFPFGTTLGLNIPDKYTALIIGPSYIKFNVDAKVVEEQLRNYSIPFKSYVHTKPGLNILEYERYIKNFLQKKNNIRFVFVDISLDGPPLIDKENRFKERALEMHTHDHILETFRSTIESSNSISTLYRLFDHGLHFLHNYTLIGRGNSLISPTLHRHRKRDQEVESRKYSQLIKKRWRDYRRNLNELKTRQENYSDLTKARSISRIVDYCQSRGVHPVFMIAPVAHRVALPAKGPAFNRFTLFDFRKVAESNQLYKDAYRDPISPEHLKMGKGSELFSKILARKISIYIETVKIDAIHPI